MILEATEVDSVVAVVVVIDDARSSIPTIRAIVY